MIKTCKKKEVSNESHCPPNITKRKPTLEQIKQFGEWLSAVRNNRGITIDELSNATGVSRSTIINLEQKRSTGLTVNTRSSLEAYFSSNVAVCTLQSINNTGLEHLRELFGQLADLVQDASFQSRVNDVASALRVSKKDAIVYIFETGLKK